MPKISRFTRHEIETAMERFRRLPPSGLSRNPEEAFQQIAHATIPLHYDVRTFPLLRSLDFRTAANREKVFKFLQARSEAAMSHFFTRFPIQTELTLSDIADAKMIELKAGSLRPADWFSLYSDIDLPSEEWPIILGGRFTFVNNQRIGIDYDSRLAFGYSVSSNLPCTDPEGEACGYPLPADWPAAQELMQSLKKTLHAPESSRSVGIVSNNPPFWSWRWTLDEITHSIEGSSESRRGDNQRARLSYTGQNCQVQGAYIMSTGPTTIVTHQWRSQVNSEVLNDTLDGNQSQFFFLPKAVWEVHGFDFPLSQFPATFIGGLVYAARYFEARKTPRWPRDLSVQLISRSAAEIIVCPSDAPHHKWRVKFGGTNAAGHPLHWKAASYQGETYVESLSVEGEQMAKTLAYAEQMNTPLSPSNHT